VRAAAVEYDRNVSFSTSNGPITLTVAVASFATTGGATAAMIRLGHRPGCPRRCGAVSTGPLADGGHATTTQGTVEGVGALQIILVWRVDNLVNSLVAEGRLGGLQLDQLLPSPRLRLPTSAPVEPRQAIRMPGSDPSGRPSRRSRRISAAGTGP